MKTRIISILDSVVFGNLRHKFLTIITTIVITTAIGMFSLHFGLLNKYIEILAFGLPIPIFIIVCITFDSVKRAKEMKCDKVKKMLSDYHDGFLSEREKKSIEKHLQECPSDCGEELRSLEALTKTLQDEGDVEAPGGYWNNDWNQLASKLPQNEPPPVPWFVLWERALIQDGRLAMASVTLAIFALAISFILFAGGRQPPVDSGIGLPSRGLMISSSSEDKEPEASPKSSPLVEVIMIKSVPTMPIVFPKQQATTVQTKNIINVEISKPTINTEGIDLAVGPDEEATPAGTGTIHIDGIFRSQGSDQAAQNVNPDVDMEIADRVENLEVRQVRILLAKHDFTNYRKHEDTLEELFSVELDPVSLANIANSRATAVFMTGDDLDFVINEGILLRQGYDVAKKKKAFTAAERNALKKYVENGGIFIFNYGEGEGVFREIIRKELIDLFGGMRRITTGRRINSDKVLAIPYKKGQVIFCEYDLLGQEDKPEVYRFLSDILFQ